MKKIIVLLCLLLNGCSVHYSTPNYVYQSPRPTYVEAPAQAPTPKVIRRTVKRTVQIIPESELKGVVK